MPLTRGDNKYRLSLDTVETDDGGFTWEILIRENRGSHIVDSKDITADSFDTKDEAEAAGRLRMTELMTQRS